MKILNRFHQRINAWGTIILMLPILIFVWSAAREPFFSVVYGYVPYNIISGKIFTEKFHTIHAGFSLDQPTIGKWLFWFSFMTILSLPYAAAVRWLSNQSSRVGCLAYSISATILFIFLLCILSWPVCWLIQYICSMGFTPRRFYGLIYGIVGGILVFSFLCWSLRKPKKERKALKIFLFSIMLSFAALALSLALIRTKLNTYQMFGFCFALCLLAGPLIMTVIWYIGLQNRGLKQEIITEIS